MCGGNLKDILTGPLKIQNKIQEKVGFANKLGKFDPIYMANKKLIGESGKAQPGLTVPTIQGTTIQSNDYAKR